MFLVDSLKKYCTCVGAESFVLIEASECLVRLINIMDNANVHMDAHDIQSMMDLYKRHMVLVERYGVYTQKHHLMLHLISRSLLFGNPKYLAVWLDESLNKQMKAALRNVHQLTFEKRALVTVNSLVASIQQKEMRKRQRQIQQ